MAAPHILLCTYVKSSEVFEGYDELIDQWAEISDFTWGTNTRTLVTFGSILEEMDAAEIDYPDSFAEMIPKGMYVDLEN